MFNNFLICINAVIPLIIYLFAGYAVKRSDLLTNEEVRRVNRMIFIVFFPMLMFDNLYHADIRQAFNPKLILFACGFVLLSHIITSVFVIKKEPSDKRRGAMIQAIYRSNFVLMGLPVVTGIFGKDNAAGTATLIMFVVPLYNILAVITLEYFRGGKAGITDIVKKVAVNPIIIGAAAAIAAIALHIKVPAAVDSVITGMSASTMPMAMILLGASFDIKALHADKRNLAICLIGRLIIVPAAGLSAAAMLGFRGTEFVSLVAMMGASTAVSSFTMAEGMDSDAELAGNAVILSTPLSCVTIFLWLFLFKTLGIF